jgi:hypothetical protein
MDTVIGSMRNLRELLLKLGQLDENVTLSARGLPALGLPSREHVVTLLAKAIEQGRSQTGGDRVDSAD